MTQRKQPASAQLREERYPARTVDVVSLKALAHPLRVQILDTLSRYGPQTAATLGQMLGESSGSTSYHLRQLARHNFVREVEGRGTARERWWERPPGVLQLITQELAADPATGEAARLVSREFEHRRATALADFMERGLDVLPAEWAEASEISTANVKLTVEQLSRFTAEVERFIGDRVNDLKDQGEQEGARPVQVHFNAFLILNSGTPQREAGRRAKETRLE